MLNNTSGSGILCVLLVSGVSALDFGFNIAASAFIRSLRMQNAALKAAALRLNLRIAGPERTSSAAREF